MGDWTRSAGLAIERCYAETPSAETFRDRYGWVEELHAKARELFDPAGLRAMPPQEVYARLKAAKLPGGPLRLAHLGRANDAAGIVESLTALLTAPADFAGKMRAAKIPQVGKTTATEILCTVKPARFIVRNTYLHRALARLVPLYTRRALEEMPYEEFLDFCRELARLLEERLAPWGLADWARDRRFLLFYAVVTGKRPKETR